MKLSQMTKNILQIATSKIVENVNKELDGQEKKASVDSTICNWISNNSSNLGLMQQFIVTKYIVPMIPVVTQAIYDCLKKKVEGLTV